MSELKIPTTPREAIALVRAAYSNRVMRFLTVGGTCGLIQLSILHALVVSGVEEHLAYVAAFVVSMELNFALNQTFTWRDRWSPALRSPRLLARLAVFHISATTSLGISLSVFSLFNLFIWYMPAAAIGICVAATTNFLLNDRLVFRLWSSSGASATIAEP
ncbi:MAG: GtrA family protein [Dehalococcoidia bacterium]|nr:GtrA family protein [Dehalococcoidia bacterium]